MNDSMMEKKLNEILKFVYSYLIKMGASKEDAEDIIQDTAYKFLQYIDSVQIDNIQSWLFRVAVNKYYDLSRKKSKGILTKLNPKYRQLLLLKYSTGLKINEIAELYSMKEGSVKTILHRARKEFIEQYRRYENEQGK